MSHPETYTVEEPTTKMASNQSLGKTENEKFESSLIDRLKNQDDIIENLQEQVKLLKENQVNLILFSCCDFQQFGR